MSVAKIASRKICFTFLIETSPPLLSSKTDVRKLAKKFGLPTAAKKDSQGICMLGAVDTKDFLKEFIKVKKGNVVHESGEIIGEHDGALLYTIGERHGISITNKKFIFCFYLKDE